jgi:hypothetical protein
VLGCKGQDDLGVFHCREDLTYALKRNIGVSALIQNEYRPITAPFLIDEFEYGFVKFCEITLLEEDVLVDFRGVARRSQSPIERFIGTAISFNEEIIVYELKLLRSPLGCGISRLGLTEN